MSAITITLGWWLLPALITLVSLIWCLVVNARDSSGGFLDGMANLFNLLVFCVVPSLIAWLAWALLR